MDTLTALQEVRYLAQQYRQLEADMGGTLEEDQYLDEAMSLVDALIDRMEEALE